MSLQTRQAGLFAVLRVADMLHPVDGFAIQPFLNRDMCHCARGGCTMPMLLVRRKPDHVARAQTGCPHGTGTGGSGQKLKAEFNKEPHVRGTTSMARASDPNSGDSQFFICFDDASFLNGQYTVWGKVSSGMENVDKIKRGEPVQNPDKIVKAHMAADAE